VLQVWVTAASVGEREGGKQVLKKVKQMGKTVTRLHTIWVDGALMAIPAMGDGLCDWIVQVVLRLENEGFVLLPKRWVSGLWAG